MPTGDQSPYDQSLRAGNERDVPEVFADYIVHEELGRGGMAMVHRAELRGPRGASKEVALKRILPAHIDLETHDDEGGLFIDRFLTEMSIAAKLSHPNIVQILNFGEHRGTYFIVMELVRGMDLRTLMRELFALAVGKREPSRDADPADRGLLDTHRAALAERTLPEHLAAFIGLQMADALAYAHQTTVHRDLAEDNCLIGLMGEPKLNDWGIAKAKRPGASAITETSRAYGKLGYMAPEQVRGDALDGRADLYALGIVLFRLLSGGRHPYDRGSVNDPFARVFRAARGDRAPIAELLPAASPSMQELLESLIQPDPHRRPASGEDLLLPLKALTGDVFDARNELRGLTRLAHRAARKNSPRQRAPRDTTRRHAPPFSGIAARTARARPPKVESSSEPTSAPVTRPSPARAPRASAELPASRSATDETAFLPTAPAFGAPPGPRLEPAAAASSSPARASLGLKLVVACAVLIFIAGAAAGSLLLLSFAAREPDLRPTAPSALPPPRGHEGAEAAPEPTPAVDAR